MKQQFLLLLSILLLTTNANSQTILKENFTTFNAGEAIEDPTPPEDLLNPAFGLWTKSSTVTGETISPVAKDTVLTYSGYASSGTGKVMEINYVDQGSDGSSSFKRGTALCFTGTNLPAPTDEGFVTGSNLIYTAYLLNLSKHSKTTSQQEIFNYHKLSSTNRGRVYFKFTDDGAGGISNNIIFGLRGNSETISNWSQPILYTTTVLLVVKYTNISNTSESNDEFELFVNPDPTKTEAENSSVKLSATGTASGLRLINFVMEGKRKMYIGGIRVASTFYDAVNQLSTMDTENILIPKSQFYAKDKTIYSNMPLEGSLQIIGTTGAVYARYELNNENCIKTNLVNGVYILQFTNSKGEKTNQKIILN